MVADPADELGYFVPDSAGLSMNAFLHFGLANGTPDLDFLYGNPGDTGLAGDWDGDGIDTFGLRRRNTIYLDNDGRGDRKSVV